MSHNIRIVCFLCLSACQAYAQLPSPGDAAIVSTLKAIFAEERLANIYNKKAVLEAVKTAQMAYKTYDELKRFNEYRKALMRDLQAVQKLKSFNSRTFEQLVLRGDRIDYWLRSSSYKLFSDLKNADRLYNLLPEDLLSKENLQTNDLTEQDVVNMVQGLYNDSAVHTFYSAKEAQTMIPLLLEQASELEAIANDKTIDMTPAERTKMLAMANDLRFKAHEFQNKIMASTRAIESRYAVNAYWKLVKKGMQQTVDFMIKHHFDDIKAGFFDSPYLPGVDAKDYKEDRNNYLQGNKRLYDAAYSRLTSVKKVAKLALLVCGFFFVVSFAYQRSQEGEFNYLPMIFKLILISTSIFTYDYWSVWLGMRLADLCGDVDGSQLVKLTNVIHSAWQYQLDNMTFWEWVNPEVVLNNLGYLILIVLALVFVWFGTTVYQFIEFHVQMIGWILGPLALALSLAPIFSHAWIKWFRNFFAACLWPFIYTIVITLFGLAFVGIFQDVIDAEVGGSMDMVYNTALILRLFLYGLAFALISVFIPLIGNYFLPDHNVHTLGGLSGAGMALLLTKGGSGVRRLVGGITDKFRRRQR